MAKSRNAQPLYSAELSPEFCPPITFSEFYERYPCVIRTRLRSIWRIAEQNLADWEHDVCVHLFTLPDRSVFRKHGCIDRVSTYDPQKRAGGSEVLFISYVHLLIDNFCRSMFRRKRLLASTVTFTELACGELADDSLDQDELLAKVSYMFRVHFDPVQLIFWKELARRAGKVDNALPNAIRALMTCLNQTDAASHLGVTEKVFAGMLKHLRALARGKQLPRRRRRNCSGMPRAA